MLRFLTAGESHGRALIAVVEGVPAGLELTVEDIADELARRRLGFGRGPRMKFERDEVMLVGGVRHGETLGSPVAIEIANSEWNRPGNKWNDEMSPAPGRTASRLTQPRPGHADLTGMQKYDRIDARDILERASARETVARVAAGSIVKALLRRIGTEVISHVVRIGAVAASTDRRPTVADLAVVDDSDVRCFDPDAEAAMIAGIKAAAKEGDSLGGVVEVLGYGIPVGLGSHVHWDRKIDGLLGQALLSIQAVKGVELGDGFTVAAGRGSDAHDAITWDADEREYRRQSTRAGGVEGGMTTGELLVARVAMKPLASLNRPTLGTVDVATKQETVSFKERTDVTAVPAMGVVAESMVALVLANEVVRKFGGDSVGELVRNVESYRMQLKGHTDRVETDPAAAEAAPVNWDPTEAFEVAEGASDDAGAGSVTVADPHTTTGADQTAGLRRPIVLVGLMGTGKSTVGKRLASVLGVAFTDTDAEIERRSGSTVADLFADRGEPAFRILEADLVAELIGAPEPGVVATGGGAVLDPATRARLLDATVVWLRASPAVLVHRIAADGTRPLLADDPRGALQRLAAEREPLYRDVADLVVEVDHVPRKLVVEQVLEALGVTGRPT